MPKRQKEIGRILKLQRQLHQLSQCLLVSLEQQEHQLAESQERMLTALSGGELFMHDRFIRNASQRLKSIAAEQARVTAARETVTAEMARQSRLMQVTEKQLSQVELIERAEEEKRELNEVVEHILCR